jgi:hypothetical protein
VKYRDGYDGQLCETVAFKLPKELWPKKKVETELINLTIDGWLTIKSAYSWDYASVPFTHWISNKLAGKKSKVPSLVHDSLCQLHRNGYLPHDESRLHTDTVFYELLLERNFWRIRAWMWFKAVMLGAKYAKQKPKEVFEAP